MPTCLNQQYWRCLSKAQPKPATKLKCLIDDRMNIRLLYFFIAQLIIFPACNSTKKMDTKDTLISTETTNQLFDKQGHRGCRGLMPENTIAAMLHALDLGVTTLELDVVITKDNQVILSHEPFFNHEISTKPDGTYVTEAEEHKLNIFQMNYDQV